MLVEKDDWKLAIEDARVRHAAVVNLILSADAQAMNLLRLYVTVATATASGSATAFSSTVAALPWAAGYGLSVATLCFVVGAYYCFLTMRSATINLPGRGAEFWLWSLHENVDRTDVFRTYLENLKIKTEMNNAVNNSNAKNFRYAKQFGMAAPLFALIVGVIAAWAA